LPPAVTWFVSVSVVTSALRGSATSVVMGTVLYGVPAVAVVIFGLLALRFVPGRSVAGHSFEQVDAG
jgi:hypothetical protein